MRRLELVDGAARADGLEQDTGLGREQDKKDIARRLFEHLEQGILCTQVHTIGVVDDENLAVTVVGQNSRLITDIAGGLDLDFAVSLINDNQIGMGTVRDLVARGARAARTGRSAGAQECSCDGLSEIGFSAAIRAG